MKYFPFMPTNYQATNFHKLPDDGPMLKTPGTYPARAE